MEKLERAANKESKKTGMLVPGELHLSGRLEKSARTFAFLTA
jgi:hypothetical protein